MKTEINSYLWIKIEFISHVLYINNNNKWKKQTYKNINRYTLAWTKI